VGRGCRLKENGEKGPPKRAIVHVLKIVKKGTLKLVVLLLPYRKVELTLPRCNKRKHSRGGDTKASMVQVN